jgi:hypothetical protein
VKVPADALVVVRCGECGGSIAHVSDTADGYVIEYLDKAMPNVGRMWASAKSATAARSRVAPDGFEMMAYRGPRFVMTRRYIYCPSQGCRSFRVLEHRTVLPRSKKRRTVVIAGIRSNKPDAL